MKHIVPRCFWNREPLTKGGTRLVFHFWKYSFFSDELQCELQTAAPNSSTGIQPFFIAICVCSLFFVVCCFYVIYFNNSKIEYCICNLKKSYLTLINTDCHCFGFLSVIPSLLSSSWWLHLCLRGLAFSWLRNMFTLTRCHIIIIIEIKYHQRWG